MDVHTITDLDLRLGGTGWDWAQSERPRIDAHWRAIAAANPHVWNGEVLICTEADITGRKLTARFAVSDFASFVAWRDWGWPDPAARNCFGVGVLKSSDGALLFGVMNQTTLNPGRSFPPAGSLEPRDLLADGTVDIAGSMRRELAEETGLDFDAARKADALLAIFDGRRLAVVQPAASLERYDALAAQAGRHIAADPKPELERVEAIRSQADIGPRMPPYAQEIVRRLLPP